MSADLRHTPRRLGLVTAWIGARIERAGIWLQANADELAYRKWNAVRRWGR